MLCTHKYNSKAFLPSDRELRYCALFETHSAHVNWTVVRIVEVFCAANVRACLDLSISVKE